MFFPHSSQCNACSHDASVLSVVGSDRDSVCVCSDQGKSGGQETPGRPSVRNHALHRQTDEGELTLTPDDTRS